MANAMVSTNFFISRIFDFPLTDLHYERHTPVKQIVIIV